MSGLSIQCRTFEEPNPYVEGERAAGNDLFYQKLVELRSVI